MAIREARAHLFCLRAAQPAHEPDRLIEGLIAAGFGYVAYQFLSGMLFHPAAADARSVGRHKPWSPISAITTV
jgi:hypothetical protein